MRTGEGASETVDNEATGVAFTETRETIDVAHGRRDVADEAARVRGASELKNSKRTHQTNTRTRKTETTSSSGREIAGST